MTHVQRSTLEGFLQIHVVKEESFFVLLLNLCINENDFVTNGSHMGASYGPIFQMHTCDEEMPSVYILGLHYEKKQCRNLSILDTKN